MTASGVRRSCDTELSSALRMRSVSLCDRARSACFGERRPLERQRGVVRERLQQRGTNRARAGAGCRSGASAITPSSRLEPLERQVQTAAARQRRRAEARRLAGVERPLRHAALALAGPEQRRVARGDRQLPRRIGQQHHGPALEHVLEMPEAAPRDAVAVAGARPARRSACASASAAALVDARRPHLRL